jgi:pimeloyl-ACP methyl ester carboxylesterase
MSWSRTTPHKGIDAREGTLQISGLGLYYRRLTPAEGDLAEDCPSLVLLHEGLGCTAMWHDFPESLVAATGLPVVSYDRQGYGRSGERPGPWQKDYLQAEARDILPRVLDKLGITNALLVGHSDGGSIALLAAADRSRNIAGIVTEAAHVFVESLTLSGIRRTVGLFETRQLEQRLARYHGDKARDVFFNWADTWLAPWFRDWNIENCLGRIQCPALIIQGREDNYGSEYQVESIVAGIGPHARSMLIPGCGHSPHRDAPEHVLGVIVEFARKLV